MAPDSPDLPAQFSPAFLPANGADRHGGQDTGTLPGLKIQTWATRPLTIEDSVRSVR
jgi:hypothetical protein